MDTRNPTSPAATGTSLPGTTPPGAAKPEQDPPRARQTPGPMAGGNVRDAARDLKDSGKDAAARASETLSSGARSAAEQAREAGSAASEQVSRLAGQAREQGAALLNQQKERAAAVADDVAAAMRRAGEKLRQENDDNLAACTEAFGDGVGSVARYLRQTEGREMRRHAENLARSHPEWVLGGAYVVGLAVARFLKASRPRPDGSESHGATRWEGGGAYARNLEPARTGGTTGSSAGDAPAAPHVSTGAAVAPVAVAGVIRPNAEVH